MDDHAYANQGPYDRLCSPKGMSRRTDPGSSHIAARRHIGTGRRQAHQAIVRALVEQYAGCTANELLEHLCPQDRERIDRAEMGKRLAELADSAKLIERGLQRECAVKGTLMLTWWPKR